MHFTNIFFFIIFSFSHTAYSRFNTSVIPITKDDSTSLHKVTWGLRLRNFDGEPYLLIDLDAPFTWKDCILRHSDIPCGLEEGCRFPLRCDTTLCKEAKSYINPVCPNLNITDKYGCGICTVTPFNPISNTCKISQMTTDLINPYFTNGRNPSPGPNQPFGSQFVLSCAPNTTLKSFPKDVRGVASFSWSGLSFPRQLSYLDIKSKFALCLPSSSSSLGVTFLGEGPYYFTTLPNVDLRSIVSYTPMVRKSSKSLSYYIKVNKISIKGTSLLSLPKGTSVRLSSRVPYTLLRSDIYNALVAGFSKAIGNVAKVNAVSPFSFCFKGGSVPNIDLETESGKVWTISRANSMKGVGNGAECLAFVDVGYDGGSEVYDAVVIGTYQMENNFLLFDLVNQKLGFSSSLLSRGTSCTGFNFTEITNG